MPYKDLEKRREVYRKYYKENPKIKEALYKRKKRYGENNIAYIRSVKDKPCADCGIKYPYYVMDLDHKFDKKFNFNTAYNQGRLKLVEEVKKCDVVCSNCHRERTHQRRMVDVVER